MALLDRIKKMREQGIDDSQITTTLIDEGVSPREISEAFAQLKVKSAVLDEGPGNQSFQENQQFPRRNNYELQGQNPMQNQGSRSQQNSMQTQSQYQEPVSRSQQNNNLGQFQDNMQTQDPYQNQNSGQMQSQNPAVQEIDQRAQQNSMQTQDPYQNQSNANSMTKEISSLDPAGTGMQKSIRSIQGSEDYNPSMNEVPKSQGSMQSQTNLQQQNSKEFRAYMQNTPQNQNSGQMPQQGSMPQQNQMQSQNKYQEPGQMQSQNPAVQEIDQRAQQENYMQNQGNYAPENYSQENYMPGQEYYDPYTQQEYAAYPDYNQGYYSQDFDIETIRDISSQVIDDKLSDLQKEIDAVIKLKTNMKFKMQAIENRLTKLESIIEQLQFSILKKIGEYGEKIENISNEVQETQNSFAKMVNPILDNQRTKTSEKQNQQTKSANKTSEKQSQPKESKNPNIEGFERFVR